jgi:enterochelin esterase family protein
VLGVAQPALAQPAAAPATVVSPEIAANGDVTLRVRAPAAERVEVVSGGDIPGVPFQGGLPLAKDDNGVFSVKLPARASGAYRYRFTVDGVATNDPANPATSESNGNAWSLFYVPGAAFMDTQRVAHGTVGEVHYYSSTLGRTRRMHVYTPGFILDNLIASGDARPMIVVMPDGHTARFAGGGAGALNIPEFVREFTADIKPYVESTYRVRTGRASTALAGLSMGGAQTLDIAFGDLESYAYVGVFSSGVFGIGENSDWENAHRAQLDDAALKHDLKLVWFSTGKDDFLLETTKATVAMLERHRFDVVYEESAGGHTWINWREYLAKFAPQLFR